MPARDDEVQALVEQLSAQLDRSVLVDDASLRLLAYSPTLGSEDEVRRRNGWGEKTLVPRWMGMPSH